MLPDGTLVPWTSAGGRPDRDRRRDAREPRGRTWWRRSSRTGYARLRRGHAVPGPDRRPKQSLETRSLYASGAPFFYAQPGADPSGDLTGWHIAAERRRAVRQAQRDPCRRGSDCATSSRTHHSAYYIDHSQPPAPLLISNGLTDDLFPADEALRFYNRTRTPYPDAASRSSWRASATGAAQNKAPTWRRRTSRAAWMDYYVKGAGPALPGRRRRSPRVPDDLGLGWPATRRGTGQRVIPGEVRSTAVRRRTFPPSAGSRAVAASLRSAYRRRGLRDGPATDQPGTATYRSSARSGRRIHALGSPTVVADIFRRAPTRRSRRACSTSIPAEHRDARRSRPLAPGDHGGQRPAGLPAAPERLPVRRRSRREARAAAELTTPLRRVSNGQHEVNVEELQLRLPVLEQPGSPTASSRAPLPKSCRPGTRSPATSCLPCRRDCSPSRANRARGRQISETGLTRRQRGLLGSATPDTDVMRMSTRPESPRESGGEHGFKFG